VQPADPAELLITLTKVRGLLRAGAPPAAAWWEGGGLTVGEFGKPDLLGEDSFTRGVKAAARLSHQTGAPLAPMLETVGAYGRRTMGAEATRRAALAGPRLSARVLMWMPAVGVALAALLDAGALTILVASPVGWVLLSAAGVLTLAAHRWTCGILAAAARAGEEP